MDANNFELKPSLIQMVQSNDQFRGTGDEDPTMHLTNFLELCGTLKMNGVCNAPNFEIRLCAAYCMIFLKICLFII